MFYEVMMKLRIKNELRVVMCCFLLGLEGYVIGILWNLSDFYCMWGFVICIVIYSFFKFYVRRFGGWGGGNIF